MQIIQPSFEILTPISEGGIEELKHIERIGRVCYKSEDRITEDGESAKKFVKMLIEHGHEAMIEHSSLSVKFTCDRGVSHEIVRHRIASFCVTGDTEIKSMNQKKWTVKELYEWQSDIKRKGRIQLISARSVDETTNTVVKNNIVKIMNVGHKDVYELKTESGRHLKCTPDHKIYTPDGYIELEKLNVGDYVYSNGKELLENRDWLYDFYIKENHTRKETAEFIGCCESFVYRAFKKFGIVKELSNRPNRKHGYGKKGMFSEEQRAQISERMKGDRNPSFIKDREKVTISGAYAYANSNFQKEECENCGSETNLEIHHKDKNPKNNSKENIIILCSKCHKLWHKLGTIGVFKEKIVSIEHIGKEDVYDVEMKSPYHNFVANGIVVHNCQESTRYCNYSNDKFGDAIKVIDIIGGIDYDNAIIASLNVRDELSLEWERAMADAERHYMRMIELGATPQIARSVLPNSTKTELTMTANYREWRNFFKLRCDSHAHPQMREIAIPLLEELKKRIPVVFDDIEH